MAISKSPDRHTFQKSGYIKRCEEKGEKPNDDYLDIFKEIIDSDKHKFDDPESRENSMEYDLLTTDWILQKVRASEAYAQNLYAAMCNNEFQKNDFLPRLKGQTWGCSWRYAGGIVADMREQGDYIDWYCSGIRNDDHYDSAEELTAEQLTRLQIAKQFVGEGVVTEEIEADLKRLGWYVVRDSND